jgi:hypothetical protein
MANFNKFGIGYCSKCGDENGPWVWTDDFGWICEDCEEKMKNENADIKKQDVPEEG